eukprot:gene29555-39180_t
MSILLSIFITTKVDDEQMMMVHRLLQVSFFIFLSLLSTLLAEEYGQTVEQSQTCSAPGDSPDGGGCGCGQAKRSLVESTRIENNAEVVTDEHILSDGAKLFLQKMIFLPGGRSVIGTDNPIMKSDGEGPKRQVFLSPFYLDKFEVSNDDFKVFIDETGYRTESEDFGWSFVFQYAIPEDTKKLITQAVLGAEWWLPVNGSYWREPEGPKTDVFSTGRGKNPVVQVSWTDATAFCAWRKGRLPTEAEWEFAARGKEHPSDRDMFPWGNKMFPDGPTTHRMNIFQGDFPADNTVEDGFEYMAPVDSFPPQNEYGFHHLIGNVWEWVQDWFTVNRHLYLDNLLDESNRNDSVDASSILRDGLPLNPTGPPIGRDKVKKGGSFFCHRSFCYRYRIPARYPTTPDSATYNVGFRCAMDADKFEEFGGVAAAVADQEQEGDEEL